jgi:hypothetical protein
MVQCHESNVLKFCIEWKEQRIEITFKSPLSKGNRTILFFKIVQRHESNVPKYCKSEEIRNDWSEFRITSKSLYNRRKSHLFLENTLVNRQNSNIPKFCRRKYK